jgi:hypothetical protein
MKTLLLILLASTSTYVFSRTSDYDCTVRQYVVDLTLTQDTSTSMWLKDRYDVMAMGYAGSLEKKEGNTIYHFYPQLGPIELTFRTQDTIDLPENLYGWIHVNAPFFVLWDKMECSRRD